MRVIVSVDLHICTLVRGMSTFCVIWMIACPLCDFDTDTHTNTTNKKWLNAIDSRASVSYSALLSIAPMFKAEM